MNELDIAVIFVLALILLGLLYEGWKGRIKDERSKKLHTGEGI